MEQIRENAASLLVLFPHVPGQKDWQDASKRLRAWAFDPKLRRLQGRLSPDKVQVSRTGCGARRRATVLQSSYSRPEDIDFRSYGGGLYLPVCLRDFRGPGQQSSQVSPASH